MDRHSSNREPFANHWRKALEDAEVVPSERVWSMIAKSLDVFKYRHRARMYGLVAAIAIMCQDSRVFAAMHSAGTYCPYDGSIGTDAKGKWEKYGKLRPDYEEYVKTLRITQQIDNEILKDMDDEQVVNFSGGTVRFGKNK